MLYERLGEYEKAIDPLFKGRILLGIETQETAEGRMARLHRSAAQQSVQEYWRTSLEYELDYYRRGRSLAISVAGAYSRLGERDKAFEWLDKELVEGDRTGMTFLQENDAFIELKSDPRYQELLRRVGLSQ